LPLSRNRTCQCSGQFGDGFLDGTNRLGVTQNEKITSSHQEGNGGSGLPEWRTLTLRTPIGNLFF
jgi:hypothetical protein